MGKTHITGFVISTVLSISVSLTILSLSVSTIYLPHSLLQMHCSCISEVFSETVYSEPDQFENRDEDEEGKQTCHLLSCKVYICVHVQRCTVI